MPIEGRQHLCGLHAEIGHPILQEADLDAFRSFAVDLHPLNALQLVDVSFHQFGVVRQLTIREAVARQGIEQAIDITEVILHDGRACPAREGGCGVVYPSA